MTVMPVWCQIYLFAFLAGAVSTLFDTPVFGRIARKSLIMRLMITKSPNSPRRMKKARRYMFFSLRDLQTAENAATLSATQKLNTGTAQL